MYRHFWGFREEPFGLGPDTALVCRSRQHDEALARLIYGVQFRKGLLALIGEPGTGKTTLLNCLREFLQTQRTDCLFLFNSRIDADQLWELIGSDLYLRGGPKSKMEVLRELRELLLDADRGGGTTVLIVDEAQNLGPDVFEEIRLLGNLEDRRGRLLQIVLAGQPEFESKLDGRALRSLKQRIACRCYLRPFTESQTCDYITARLNQAGMTEQTVFPPDVLAEIHVRSQGIPRVINTICDNLLVTAFALENRVTTLDMLNAVSTDLRLEWDSADAEQKTRDAGADQDDAKRLDTACLARLGLLPPGFHPAAGPPVSPLPANADAQILLNWQLDGFTRESRFESMRRRIGNAAGVVARCAVKSARAFPSHCAFVFHRFRTAIEVVIRILRRGFSPLTEFAFEVRRGALVSLIVLVCIAATVLLWKPVASRIRALPAGVSFASSLRSGAAVRSDGGSPQVTAVRQPAAIATPIEETGPRALRLDPAEYTPAARSAGFHGKVFVVVTVDRQGRVRKIQPTGPTAFDLDAAVREAAPGWRFQPAMRDGKLVEGRTLLQVPFR
jgi:general secretion pathway protein A